jgi:hypothetical protein
MGAQLVHLYDEVAKEFGPIGRMNLALLTKISSDRAKTEPDSPANLTAFQQAITQLRKQGGKS